MRLVRMMRLLFAIACLSIPLSSRAQQKQTALDDTGQWMMNPGVSHRVAVRKSGFYRISVPTDVDPGTLSILYRGQERAAMVLAPSGSSNSASVVFYAEGLDTPFTDEAVYWLARSASPRRMTTAAVSSASTVATAYQAELTQAYRSIALIPLNNGDADNFFGPVISTTGAQQTLTIDNLNSASTFERSLKVVVQGATPRPHAFKVTLNDVVLGTAQFEGTTVHTQQWSLPPGLLKNGANTVVLTRSSADLSDVALLDTLSLKFGRNLVATQNTLDFHLSANQHAVLSGFTSSNVRVFDVTSPSDPVQLPATVSASAPYEVEVDVQGASSPRHLIALSEDNFVQDQAFAPYAIGDDIRMLGSPDVKADLLVVSPRDFSDVLSQLLIQRRKEGLNVVVMHLESLYDAFTFGEKDPSAIQAWVKRAYTGWATAPQFLLLVGDATIDPRNRLGFGFNDVLPALRVNTQFGEAASDDRFGDIDADGFAEVAVGRLPVRSAQETTIMIEKMLNWQPRAAGTRISGLFMSDWVDGYRFEKKHRELAENIPAIPGARFVTRVQDVTQTRQAMVDTLANGVDVVGYFGHGSNEIWAGRVLDPDQIAVLPKMTVPPLYMIMNCLNGSFMDVYTESVAERLLRLPQAGATAVWASSGLTGVQPQVEVYEAALKFVFREKLPLGEAFRLAKRVAKDADVRNTWNFLGDPSMRFWVGEGNLVAEIDKPIDAQIDAPMPNEISSPDVNDGNGNQVSDSGKGLGGGTCSVGHNPSHGFASFLFLAAVAVLYRRRLTIKRFDLRWSKW